MRKLVAAIACRNNGSRLYGKPLQNLDIENGISVLDNIIGCLKQSSTIDEIVLGIAEGIENDVYEEYASSKNISNIRGNENNVLSRLIKCGVHSGATDIFRLTSESPFPFFELFSQLWAKHLTDDNDATFLDDIIDGCGYQIISMDALRSSHEFGSERHRSELISQYIRENSKKYKIGYLTPPSKFIRKDIRLTVDYPEDLILCRAVYENFRDLAPNIPLNNIVEYLDDNPQLIKLTLPFCDEGYKKMYLKFT